MKTDFVEGFIGGFALSTIFFGLILSCGNESKPTPSPEVTVTPAPTKTCTLTRTHIVCPDGKIALPKDGQRGSPGADGSPGVTPTLPPIPTPVNGSNGLPGEPGTDGVNGVDGNDGQPGVNGTSVTLSTINVVVDRSLLPWSDNNKTVVNKDMIVIIPEKFTINVLTPSLTGGGWLDFIVGDITHCFQRKNNTKQFEYSYTKMTGYTTGCDTVSEQGDNYTGLEFVSAGEHIQIIPREPKLSGLIVTFTFNGFMEE